MVNAIIENAIADEIENLQDTLSRLYDIFQGLDWETSEANRISSLIVTYERHLKLFKDVGIELVRLSDAVDARDFQLKEENMRVSSLRIINMNLLATKNAACASNALLKRKFEKVDKIVDEDIKQLLGADDYDFLMKQIELKNAS